jgi:hypothetical protein
MCNILKTRRGALASIPRVKKPLIAEKMIRPATAPINFIGYGQKPAGRLAGIPADLKVGIGTLLGAARKLSQHEHGWC